ncbi:MAG: hypothetical protein IJZ36_02725 [Bacilli bacterium]|nr:hypothetical protein [Bacilli bacterium]
MLNILAAIDCTLKSVEGVTITSEIARVIQLVYNGIRFGVPLLLILFGMLDLGKAVIAQKEDDIKKGQQTFIKRLIAAVVVFFIFSIVLVLVGAIDPGSGIGTDLRCILTGEIK